ncbi:MAG: hypothetical protein GY950_22415 [bacterium]|nr:hypothetical protein [bacterium]
MDIILSIVVFAAVLSLAVLEEYFFKIVFFRSQRFISKLVSAFLCGFIVFSLFTGNIPRLEQRFSIIIVSLLLIYANLFLGKPKEEEDDEEKEKK